MITITGQIVDASGAALHARLDFVSKSTPLVGAGIVTTNTDKTIRSNPSSGGFSVQLAAGNYAVTISANGQTTAFNIAVPDGTSTLPIESVVSTPLIYPNVAPMLVWNGIRQGHVTFAPIANPPAPTTAPHVLGAGGGHQTNIDVFAYQIAWITPTGDTTIASADVTSTAPTGANDSTRITLPSPPSGVGFVNIFRSTNDATPNRYLLAQVAQNVTFYDDWESTANFNARLDPTLTAPVYNNTAGQFFGAVGSNPAFWITDQGLRVFLHAQFDGDINFAGANYRHKNGQLQMWDSVAAAADPTHPWRAMSVVNGNTVWSDPIAN